MNRIGIIVFAMAMLLLGTLAACQQGPVSSSTIDQDSAITLEPAAEYKLGNGDGLRVTVFGEPELSGDYKVDGVGNISMPLIGTFEVAGLTVQEFQRRAQELYRERDFLKTPRVSAEVTTFRPYYILGEVNNPGEYPYSSGLTVLKAVATAQGFTYRANRRFVYIRGDDATVERKVTLTDTTPVQPGDTIRIDERIF